jgi:hypothetical protein
MFYFHFFSILKDPLKQSQNPLGSRSEISHTINWVRSHLEQDDKVSIPKQEVYEDYVYVLSLFSYLSPSKCQVFYYYIFFHF